jgi:hypothetical protein
MWYLVGVNKLTCYCLNTHLLLCVFTNNHLTYLSNWTSKKLVKCYISEFFCPTQVRTIPLVTCKILQLMSWWIFYVQVLYKTCRQGTWISEPAFVEWTWGQVTSDCCRLLQQLAFSESCHFSWDTFPANTMAYDRGRAPACCHHSWRSRHRKSMQWIWTGARCFVCCVHLHIMFCVTNFRVCVP